jgi:5-formaminoimidazole-4-carboxamide-1-beta-D-ribofuranosyl 5'-monophosphate synthetase
MRWLRWTLTEEAEMCLAVSRFSEKAKSIIEEGIITIEQLQFMTMESHLVGPIPECKELIAYLEAQLDFMEESMNDYGAAAEGIKKVPKPRK